MSRHETRARQQAAALLVELRALGSEANRAGMSRYGINVEHACGVSVRTLRTLAARIGSDHELALALWATGQHEARLLACFVDDPQAVTEAQAEAWAGAFDSWDLCDQATTSLFDRTPLAWPKAVQWAQRDESWVRRAGFTLMAGLAVHDKVASDRAFMKLLPLIEQAATDDRNFVRKAVSWALRNIGKRNRALNAAALACARRILAAANTRAGGPRGGDPGTRSARWVARDAMGELDSDRLRARLQGRESVCQALHEHHAPLRRLAIRLALRPVGLRGVKGQVHRVRDGHAAAVAAGVEIPPRAANHLHPRVHAEWNRQLFERMRAAGA